jgi:Glycosyl transferase family 2
MLKVQKTSKRASWFRWGSLSIYVVSAFLAAYVNSWSLNRALLKVENEVAQNLRTVLLGFTAISVLVLGLQFLFARVIGHGRKASLFTGVNASLVIAGIVFLTSLIGISSSWQFRSATGLLIATGVFLAVLPCAFVATMLINQQWKLIGILILFTAFIRALLWQFPWFADSLHGLLLGILITNLAVYLVAAVLNHVSKFQVNSEATLRGQLIPGGILFGLIVLLVSGSTSRRNTLGMEVIDFAEATLIGRQVFLLTVVIAYATFPALCNSPLFSRDLRRSYRQAQLVTTAFTVFAGAIVWIMHISSNPSKDGQLLLLIQVIAWIMFSIALTPVLFYLAHGSKIGLAVFVPALLMLTAQIVVTSAMMLASIFLISNALLLVLAMVPALLRVRPVAHSQRLDVSAGRGLQNARVTVLIPSFNPGPSVVRTIWETHRAFLNDKQEIRIIVISDGSTDESIDLLNDIQEDWFLHLQLPYNQGKGAALIAGLQVADTTFVGFIDADGDIPPSLLPGMFAAAIEDDADVVFGSKWHPESNVQVSKARSYMSKVHHFLQLRLFRLDIDDTQVGIKIFKADSIRLVLENLKERGFSLELEIFVALAAHGKSKFVEMPVTIVRSGSSTISIKLVIQTIRDMMKIFWRSRIELRYDSLAYENTRKRTEA